MADSELAHESKDKIRDVLSSILGSAVDFGLLVKNPVEATKMPFPKIGKRRNKPYVTPQQFDELLARMPEPYSSMVYVAVYTGLRVSELAGLRWNDIQVAERIGDGGVKHLRYTISIDERSVGAIGERQRATSATRPSESTNAFTSALKGSSY